MFANAPKKNKKDVKEEPRTEDKSKDAETKVSYFYYRN